MKALKGVQRLCTSGYSVSRPSMQQTSAVMASGSTLLLAVRFTGTRPSSIRTTPTGPYRAAGSYLVSARGTPNTTMSNRFAPIRPSADSGGSVLNHSDRAESPLPGNTRWPESATM